MRIGKFGVLLIPFFLLLVASTLSAQTNCSFAVLNLGGYSQGQIDQALLAANLDSYRLKTQRRSMKFTNGAEVELYSAEELQQSSCPVNMQLAMDDDQELDPLRRFEIHPSGVIYEVAQAVYKH